MGEGSMKNLDRSALIIIFSALFPLLSGACSALDVQVGEEQHPAGAVLLVVDGLGASYVYPERSPYALDGTPLGRCVLFNLTGGGARVMYIRARVPETIKSHSIIVTGSPDAVPELLGRTMFDIARENGYLTLAVLQHGDFREMLIRQDGALYIGNSSVRNMKATLRAGRNLPQDLQRTLERWRNASSNYTAGSGTDAYIGCDRWGIDAACDLIEGLCNRSFLLIINVGAVDAAGQNLGEKGYLETVQALDAPLGRLEDVCKRRNVILIITADHGMAFSDVKDKGGHSAAKYSGRLESLRIPLVVFGPGVDELSLGGIWFEENIAPTILDLLGLPEELSFAKPLPLKDGYELRVTNASGEVFLYRGSQLLANASGDDMYVFKGLKRGLYTLVYGHRSMNVCINGDCIADLSGASGKPFANTLRIILGVIIILAINIAGVALIIRILKRG
jgi:2,3-bisphosphoglycerate-independent phosphoglycerate mutase